MWLFHSHLTSISTAKTLNADCVRHLPSSSCIRAKVTEGRQLLGKVGKWLLRAHFQLVDCACHRLTSVYWRHFTSPCCGRLCTIAVSATEQMEQQLRSRTRLGTISKSCKYEFHENKGYASLDEWSITFQLNCYQRSLDQSRFRPRPRSLGELITLSDVNTFFNSTQLNALN